ncbi:hypothetical protein GCM10027570_48050 [Streptomonospora sediminis]
MSTIDNPVSAADHATAAELRRELVGELKERGRLGSAAIEQALLAVPRHLFLPDAPVEDVYTDKTIDTKLDGTGQAISCASQPSVVATMLHQLGARSGQRVLELGAGTGYNAALLGHLVGGRGRVTTVDIDSDLVETARRRLAALGAGNVEAVCGDGALGHATGAPYDRVIATVGTHHMPPAWLDQLAEGGRLVAPVRIAGDVSRSIAFESAGDHWASVDSSLCTFVPLRGGTGDDPRRRIDLTGDCAVVVQANQDQFADEDRLRGVLDQPRHEFWTGVTFGGNEPLDPMWLWLALRLDNSLSRMPVRPEAIDDEVVTPRLPWGNMAAITPDSRGLAYLTLRPAAGGEGRHEAGVIAHTGGGARLAEQMAAEIAAWEPHRGRRLSFALHPRPATVPASAPEEGRFAVQRGRAHLVVQWRDAR